VYFSRNLYGKNLIIRDEIYSKFESLRNIYPILSSEQEIVVILYIREKANAICFLFRKFVKLLSWHCRVVANVLLTYSGDKCAIVLNLGSVSLPTC
jgi:hypothetical protein